MKNDDIQPINPLPLAEAPEGMVWCDSLDCRMIQDDEEYFYLPCHEAPRCNGMNVQEALESISGIHPDLLGPKK